MKTWFIGLINIIIGIIMVSHFLFILTKHQIGTLCFNEAFVGVLFILDGVYLFYLDNKHKGATK